LIDILDESNGSVSYAYADTDVEDDIDIDHFICWLSLSKITNYVLPFF
jgi:hypothetical protein